MSSQCSGPASEDSPPPSSFDRKVNRGLDPETELCSSSEESHRANSADTCVDGALPVPRLYRFLGEEEVHFIVVSVDVVGDEVSGDEFRIWEERRQRRMSGCRECENSNLLFIAGPRKKYRQASGITFLTIIIIK